MVVYVVIRKPVDIVVKLDQTISRINNEIVCERGNRKSEIFILATDLRLILIVVLWVIIICANIITKEKVIEGIWYEIVQDIQEIVGLDDRIIDLDIIMEIAETGDWTDLVKLYN